MSRKNSWSSLSAISIAILLFSTSETAILARIWASRNFRRPGVQARVAARGGTRSRPGNDRASARPLAHRGRRTRRRARRRDRDPRSHRLLERDHPVRRPLARARRRAARPAASWCASRRRTTPSSSRRTSRRSSGSCRRWASTPTCPSRRCSGSRTTPRGSTARSGSWSGRRRGAVGRAALRDRRVAPRREPRAAGQAVVERDRGHGRGAPRRLARPRARLRRRPRPRRARRRAAAPLLRGSARLGRGRRGRETAPGRPRRRSRGSPSISPTRRPRRRRSCGATPGSATRCRATARSSPSSTGRWWRWATRASTSAGGSSATTCSPPGRAGRASPASRARRRRWSAGRQLTGREAGDLHWFLVFAALRFTVVMLRLSTLLVAMGYSPEPFGYDNPISNALDRLLPRA